VETVVAGRELVPSISIGPAALDKILRDRAIFIDLRGRDQMPRLAYYLRCYSTLTDGRVIEHGDGLGLDFIEPREAGDGRYLTLELDGNCTIALEPRDKFQVGSHSIDWIDRKFTVASRD
jgi:hypothetical protein